MKAEPQADDGDGSGLVARQIRFLDWGAITLELARGEVVGLRGASGSGKSLLLRALADLIPWQGCLSWAGRSAERCTGPEWRKQVGLLPANPTWWLPNVGAHFPTSPTDGLEPLGLPESILSEGAERLSTGERQRLALLRLAARETVCWLLDEPTANLDPESAQCVEAWIREQVRRRDLAVLWVGHDGAQLDRVSDRQFVMQNRGLSDWKGSDG